MNDDFEIKHKWEKPVAYIVTVLMIIFLGFFVY